MAIIFGAFFPIASSIVAVEAMAAMERASVAMERARVSVERASVAAFMARDIRRAGAVPIDAAIADFMKTRRLDREAALACRTFVGDQQVFGGEGFLGEMLGDFDG